MENKRIFFYWVNRLHGEEATNALFYRLLGDSPNNKNSLPFINHSKCYTTAMAFSGIEVENSTSFGKKWRIFANIGDFMYIMVRNTNGVVSCAPLFIHRFQFLRPHFLADSEKFNTTELGELKTTADKLRYYRYKKGLLQRDVADYVGIERTTYHTYEADERNYFPLEILEQIAELLEVTVVDLLDDYSTFLYNGQARQLKTCESI